MKITLTNADVTVAIQDYISKQLPALASQEIALEYTLSRGVMPQLSIDLHIGADAQVFLDSRTKAAVGTSEVAPAPAAAVVRSPRTVAPKVKAEEQLDLEVDVAVDEPSEETTEDDGIDGPVEPEVEVEVVKPKRTFARKV